MEGSGGRGAGNPGQGNNGDKDLRRQEAGSSRTEGQRGRPEQCWGAGSRCGGVKGEWRDSQQQFAGACKPLQGFRIHSL